MITVHNQSAYRFQGWRRCTVSDHPGPQGGVTKSGHLFVVGNAIGIAGYAVDVLVDLEPGQRVTIDTEGAAPFASPVVPLLPKAALADPVGFFGVPTIAGQPLSFAGMETDGACLLLHLRRRLSGPAGYGILFDLWLHIYGELRYSVDGGSTFVTVPLQRWAIGVLQATCSDVSSPLLRQDVLFDVKLECGDANVWVGSSEAYVNEPFMLAGDWFADGQCKRWPVTLEWKLNHGRPSQVHAFGLSRIGFLGTPAEQGNLDLPSWLASRLPKVEAALADWTAPWNIGVPANSTQSGDEEEQGFSQGFEPFYPGGIAGIRTRLLEAYVQGRRPCHHLERDGTIVDPANHPDLVYWQGRPHGNKGVSPDQFGKPRTIGAGQTHGGWYGPDREHWLIHTTAAAYELTGDPALQDELRHQAMLFLGGETVRPGWSTSSTDAARSFGYAGMVVCHLWRLLQDRTLAERVRDRWIQRLEMVYIPRWGHLDFWQPVATYYTDANGIKHPTTMGAAVGMNVPYAVMAYQQAVGAFGGYCGARMFGHQGGMELAMHGANAVWQIAYHDGICYETLGLNENGDFCGRYVEGDGVHSSMNFAHEWTPLAVWVAAQDDPQAAEFYATLRENAREGARNDRSMDWFPSLDWFQEM